MRLCDDRASVDHRGVGLAGLLSDLQQRLGEALAGLQFAAHARHRGCDEARVPSLRRLPCLLGDRLQHARAPRRPARTRRARSPSSAPAILTTNSTCRSCTCATSALSSRTCSDAPGRACPAPSWRSRSSRAPRRASADRPARRASATASSASARRRACSGSNASSSASSDSSRAWRAGCGGSSSSSARSIAATRSASTAPSLLTKPRLFASAARAARSASRSSEAIPRRLQQRLAVRRDRPSAAARRRARSAPRTDRQRPPGRSMLQGVVEQLCCLARREAVKRLLPGAQRVARPPLALSADTVASRQCKASSANARSVGAVQLLDRLRDALVERARGASSPTPRTACG